MTISYIGNTFSVSNSVTRTPANAGNELILQLITHGGSPVLTSVTDSTSATVITDFPFTLSGGMGMGIYRVHGASAVSHTINVNWSTAPTNIYLTLNEASGIGSVDSLAGTPAINSGSSTTPTTGSLTPSKNGDFLLATFTINHFLNSLGSWTNGFTQTRDLVGGPSYAEGYLIQGSSASVNAGITIDQTQPWYGLLVAYSPGGAVYSIPANEGGYSLSGKAATLNANIGTNYTLSNGFGAYAIASEAATLAPTIVYYIIANASAYDYVGGTSLRTFGVVSQVGSYIESGSIAMLQPTVQIPNASTAHHRRFFGRGR